MDLNAVGMLWLVGPPAVTVVLVWLERRGLL